MPKNPLDRVMSAARKHPLPLALLTDVLMLVPYVDAVFTVPLQFLLWASLDDEWLMALNIAYDIAGEFVIPVFGDVLPVNTAAVIIKKYMM